MPMRDSLDKVITSYFAAVNAAPFTYKGRTYPVRPLVVSPLLLRGFTCPPQCGGCCPTFSLDYLPEEQHPYRLRARLVEFDGRHVVIMSDQQATRTEHHCRNLNMSNGRCGIHGKQPFSCDFELIRFLHPQAETAPTRMLTRLFGRGHAMLRVDDHRGALCEITPATPESRDDTIRKLLRLAQWCDHFGVAHRVGYIVEWARTSPQQPLILPGASASPTLF